MGRLSTTLGAAWDALCADHGTRRGRNAFAGMLGTLLFLFPFGLVFVALQVLPERFSWTSSVVIVLSAIVTALSESRAVAFRRAAAGLLLLCALLFGIEYLGVTTGMPFGRYTYTSSLGLTVAGVPLAIACAWYSTVMNAWRISRGLSAGRAGSMVRVPASAAVLTLALDIALEPMASRVTRYWLWEGDHVPLQNYATWMVFAGLASMLLSRFYDTAPAQRDSVTLTSGLVLGMQFILFLTTDLAQGFVGSAVLALVVAALPVLARQRWRLRHAPGRG